MQYNFYLLGVDNRIRATDTFSASNDEDAAQIAGDAYLLAQDEFGGFELWRYGTLLSGSRGPRHVRVPSPAAWWSDVRQQRALELEERLESSFECIRSSRELMKRIDELRAGPTMRRA